MKKIVVFDSGVGGLSIASHLAAYIKGVQIDFVSDRLNFPYGTKTEKEVTEAITQTVEKYLSTQSADIAVIACNTASTVALEHLRKSFKIPFVGVVPAIKPACQITRTRSIALLATPGTVARQYTKDLIDQFSGGVTVHLFGSSELVEIAERKIASLPVELDDIDEVMQSIFQIKDIDTVVLGCTHFPLLIDELSILSPRKINWVDSTNAITNRVCELTGLVAEGNPHDGLNVRYFSTGEAAILGEYVFNSLIQ